MRQDSRRPAASIEPPRVDADDPAGTAALIREVTPDLVINVALPYQDLSIMEGALKRGHYLDTANYEPPDEAAFSYKWQRAYNERFKRANLMALLGSGFDPGVTNVFCAHALKHHFDEIHEIDIMDCNAGVHGIPSPRNFNPEINIRRSPRGESTGKRDYGRKPTLLPCARPSIFPKSAPGKCT